MMSLSRHCGKQRFFSHKYENPHTDWVIIQFISIELKELKCKDVWSIDDVAHAMTSLRKPITRLSMQVNMHVGTIKWKNQK